MRAVSNVGEITSVYYILVPAIGPKRQVRLGEAHTRKPLGGRGIGQPRVLTVYAVLGMTSSE